MAWSRIHPHKQSPTLYPLVHSLTHCWSRQAAHAHKYTPNKYVYTYSHNFTCAKHFHWFLPINLVSCVLAFIRWSHSTLVEQNSMDSLFSAIFSSYSSSSLTHWWTMWQQPYFPGCCCYCCWCCYFSSDFISYLSHSRASHTLQDFALVVLGIPPATEKKSLIFIILTVLVVQVSSSFFSPQLSKLPLTK